MENRYSNEEFHKDLEAARKGLTDEQLTDLVEKWGPRGGAFFGFFIMPKPQTDKRS